MTLDSILQYISDDRPPPLHLWNPDFCGDIDMVIKRDGTWHYMGSPIGRQRMVRLFSRVLKKEGDKYFLVTPVEKIGITVEDAPFVTTALDFHTRGDHQVISVETNVGDKIIVGAGNPIRVFYQDKQGQPNPYVMIRKGLEARISRPHFYDLVDKSVEKNGTLLISSEAQEFSLGAL